MYLKPVPTKTSSTSNIEMRSSWGSNSISNESARDAASHRLEKGGTINDFILILNHSLTAVEKSVNIQIGVIVEDLAKKKIEECKGDTSKLMEEFSNKLKTLKDLYVAKEAYIQLALQKQLPENAQVLKEQLQQKEAEEAIKYIKENKNTLEQTPHMLEPGEYLGGSGGYARAVLVEKYDKEVIAKVKEGLKQDGKEFLLTAGKQQFCMQ